MSINITISNAEFSRVQTEVLGALVEAYEKSVTSTKGFEADDKTSANLYQIVLNDLVSLGLISGGGLNGWKLTPEGYRFVREKTDYFGR